MGFNSPNLPGFSLMHVFLPPNPPNPPPGVQDALLRAESGFGGADGRPLGAQVRARGQRAKALAGSGGDHAAGHGSGRTSTPQPPNPPTPQPPPTPSFAQAPQEAWRRRAGGLLRFLGGRQDVVGVLLPSTRPKTTTSTPPPSPSGRSQTRVFDQGTNNDDSLRKTPTMVSHGFNLVQESVQVSFLMGNRWPW